MQKYVLVIGASMVDLYGHTPDCEVLSGCHNGSVHLSYGGVARNIAENLARIQTPCEFISVFGNDLTGIGMYKQLRGINCGLSGSQVVDEASATFMAITNVHHHVVGAIADHHIMKHLTMDYLLSKRELIEQASLIIFDVNDYFLYEQFVTEFKHCKILVDPVSIFKAKKIKHLIHHFQIIKPNIKEAEVLCGFEIKNDEDLKQAGAYFSSQGIERIYITLDQEGVYVKTNGLEGVLKACSVEVQNEVGAGDAFVAGIASGILLHTENELDLLKMGYAMALLSLKSPLTVNESQSLKDCDQMIQSTQWVYRPLS